MDSSTSHSKTRFPARAAGLLLTIVAAWAACAFYSLRLNPEVTHYAHGGAIKLAWTKKMAEEHGNKVVVFGGSSCEFSIDGERMLDHDGLPTVNWGGHAGMGAPVLTEAALAQVKPGDTLIMAMEPGLLTTPLLEPSLGVQYSFAMHHADWVTDPVLGVGRVNWFQAATGLRPGGYNFFTMAGKVLRHQSLYRYKLSDYHASGWKQTDVRIPMGEPGGYEVRLSDDSVTLLRNLRTWCDQHSVRLAYSLPWSYAPADKVRAFQKLNAQFLLQVVEIMPVLKDPRLGADADAGHYADTNYHLVSDAAALRTDELADQIKRWDVWTMQELKDREAQL